MARCVDRYNPKEVARTCGVAICRYVRTGWPRIVWASDSVYRGSASCFHDEKLITLSRKWPLPRPCEVAHTVSTTGFTIPRSRCVWAVGPVFNRLGVVHPTGLRSSSG